METLPPDLFPDEAPALDFTRRDGAPSPASIRSVLDSSPACAGLPEPRRRLLEGLALLWNDHHEAAHAVAQAREGDSDFDLLHAIFHRREGDYPNSRYWSGSAGRHPCYTALADAVAGLPHLPPALRAALLPGGLWSPAGFLGEVSAFMKSGKKTDTAEAGKARRRLEAVQALEIRALAAHALGV